MERQETRLLSIGTDSGLEVCWNVYSDTLAHCSLSLSHYLPSSIHYSPPTHHYIYIFHIPSQQSDLVKVRQSYAEITATQRRLLKQKEQADAVADDWYQRAQLALQKGNEELAREALSRRQQQLDAASSLQDQIDTQAASIDKLYEGMQALENKIMESKAKKEQMIARARTAQSTQQVNDMLGGITGKTSMDAFSRMEEKVEALEAAAEISAEMGSLDGKALPGSSESSLESQFRALEGASAVDDELAKMKGLLGGSSSGGDKTGGSGVDDELEKLKKDAGL